MSALAGLPVLNAAAMRDAEAAAGVSPTTLMERAGAGIARWTARLAGGADVLVLCGPGSNGGDGYIAARQLAEQGVSVRIAALAPPRGEVAGRAAAAWQGPVATIDEAPAAPVVVDAILGTGVNRPLDSPAARRLLTEARLRIAVDVPSGLDADGAGRADAATTARCDVTLALGALKPAHLLQPGATLCGQVRIVDIGLGAIRPVAHVLARPNLSTPGPEAHKYSRGMVAVVAGAMPGASRMAAEAALRGGAGYVAILGDDVSSGPAALVRRPLDRDTLAERRIGAVVVGPGLGRDPGARERLALALNAGHPLVIDGDALHMLSPDAIPANSVLTPHGGEFDALFGAGVGSKLDRTIAAARRAGVVVVHKGADTVVAAPDGRAVIAPYATGWLATAGTGDVLAGAIGARLAAVRDPFLAAQEGVWLHARAAALLNGALIADDLPVALGRALAGR